jgi:hypothetical protein
MTQTTALAYRDLALAIVKARGNRRARAELARVPLPRAANRLSVTVSKAAAPDRTAPKQNLAHGLDIWQQILRPTKTNQFILNQNDTIAAQINQVYFPDGTQLQ